MSYIEKAKLNIGNLALPSGLVVAPMAGISDRTFRRLCMKMGADYSVSESIVVHFGYCNFRLSNMQF